MLHKEPPHERPLSPDDPVLHPGWRLIDFLVSLGADEIALSFIGVGSEGRAAIDQLAQRISFASLGERSRECTVTYVGASNPRPVEVWRLDRHLLTVLRELMPSGILGSEQIGSAWIEDLCIYRRGGLMFGAVTHERYSFLRLSDAEWRSWEAWVRETDSNRLDIK